MAKEKEKAKFNCESQIDVEFDLEVNSLVTHRGCCLRQQEHRTVVSLTSNSNVYMVFYVKKFNALSYWMESATQRIQVKLRLACI